MAEKTAENSAKTFVLDTSVILENSESISDFADSNNTVIILPRVFSEIADNKKGVKQKNYNAREALKILLNLSSRGDLHQGVKTKNGGIVKIMGASQDVPKMPLNLSQGDNEILQSVKTLNNNGQRAILVTMDTAMIIAARQINIEVQEFEAIRVDLGNIYKGYEEVFLTPDQLKELDNNHKIVGENRFYENQFLIINNNYDLLVRHQNGRSFKRPYLKKINNIGPRSGNLPQCFAWDLLFDNNIGIVILFGPAGTGKTFLALLAALAQTKGSLLDSGYQQIYDNIIIITPMVSLSREQDLGWLPGDKFEKIYPWVQAIFDNGKLINGQKIFNIVSDLRDRKCLEFENINYIRGRNLSNAFIIIDEAQNFTQQELKLIGTRAAEGTKVVLTGDPDQVNRSYLKEDNNGLVYAVEAFKDCPEAGSVFLDKVVRSRVAELFAEKF